MTESTPKRLLPWSAQGGGPSYLIDDDSPQGVIARMADAVEEQQTNTAEFVLAGSRDLMKLAFVRDLSPVESKYVVNRLCECLEDMLRISESRGDRLMTLESAQDEEDDEEPEDPDGVGD